MTLLATFGFAVAISFEHGRDIVLMNQPLSFNAFPSLHADWLVPGLDGSSGLSVFSAALALSEQIEEASVDAVERQSALIIPQQQAHTNQIPL